MAECVHERISAPHHAVAALNGGLAARASGNARRNDADLERRVYVLFPSAPSRAALWSANSIIHQNIRDATSLTSTTVMTVLGSVFGLRNCLRQ